MTDKKYYVPDIEDFCVGYECEVNWNKGHEEEFIPIKLKICDELEDGKRQCYSSNVDNVLIAYDDGYAEFRTSFLTQEQIEAEGWKFIGKSVDIWFEKEGIMLRYDGHHFKKVVIHYGLHDHRLTVNPHFVSGGEEKFFEGECKSINEFRKIFKLLGIE